MRGGGGELIKEMHIIYPCQLNFITGLVEILDQLGKLLADIEQILVGTAATGHWAEHKPSSRLPPATGPS